MKRFIVHPLTASLCFLLVIQCSLHRIDREAVVKRHIPKVNCIDPFSPFTVGNGEFAFTPDVTGLQSFPEMYEKSIPLGTHAQWAWHTFPNPNRYSLDQTYEMFELIGRKVPYASGQFSEAGQWLRANPHKLHLGRIGFVFEKEDGSQAAPGDIRGIDQTENIWQGIIESRFTIEGNPVQVRTACHPDLDQIAVRVESKLLDRQRVAIHFQFPYGSASWGPESADWNLPDKHTSVILEQENNHVLIRRILDADTHYVDIRWNGDALFSSAEPHTFLLRILRNDFSLTCHFSPNPPNDTFIGSEKTFRASRKYWNRFWETGAAVDFSECTDLRALELERRVILSRYLTAIQCAGSMPPAETGLTCNSWYGKCHLEMHGWHGVHFILWNKPELFERSLDWYQTIFPIAKQTASIQGYEGIRWPKMVGPDGRESPSTIGPFLCWQQSHLIYFAELLYRTGDKTEVLTRFQDLIFATADFMASYVQWDESKQQYNLGPPLIPAQEIYDPDSTLNPGFELAYWKYGLQIAQQWKERLGLPRNAHWDRVIAYLAPLPVHDGLYQNAENALNTFDDPRQREDHPTLLAPYGLVPGRDVDKEVMEKTLEAVMQSWDWESVWGWDFPLIAMTAARLGRPDFAVDALLMDVTKNTYLNNGHNYQRENLPVYLPGNGGFLTAVAMMAGGWDSAPDTPSPGFPKDGKWHIKAEGFNPYP